MVCSPASAPAAAARTLGAAAATALVLLAGCSLHNPHPVGSFERGAYYVEKGNNVEAVEALESFVRHNPTDSLAAEAQYLKGTTYVKMAEYPLAAVEFQILRKDYPVSDRVEDASFMEGVAYLRQVGHIQRDATGAVEARRHFVAFLETYPGSEHVPEVRAYLREISDMMVEKRLSQIRVYRQLGRHEAVAITLDGVLQDEADSSLLDEVIWQRARTAERLEDPDTADVMYRRLVDEYPDGRYADRARNALRKRQEAADEGEDA